MKSLMVAVAALALSAPGAWPAENAGSTVVVRGVLVDREGAPIEGAVLHVAALDNAGKAFVELRGTQLLSPTATADSEGRFAVAVPVSFFAAGAAFTVGIARPAAGLPPGVERLALAPALRNGIAVSFPYPAKRRVVELGEILPPVD